MKYFSEIIATIRSYYCLVLLPAGNPNASIPTPQPVRPRPMFGAFGVAVGANSVVFVSQASLSLHNYIACTFLYQLTDVHWQ